MTTNFEHQLLKQKEQRQFLYRKFTLWLIAIAVIITAYYLIFYAYVGLDALVLPAVVFCFLFAGLGVAVLRGANLFLAFRLYITITFIAFLFEILYTGGLKSSVVPHLIYVPLLSLFYGKRKDLVFFFLLTLVAVLSLFTYQCILDNPVTNFLQDEEMVLVFNFTNYLFILLAVLPLAFFFKYELRKTNKSLKQSILDQQRTYDQLLHKEKLASIGQLTAGVAHEVNNPAHYLQLGSQQLLGEFHQLKEYLRFQEQALKEMSNGSHHSAAQSEWQEKVADKKKSLLIEELMSETESNLNIINDGAQRIADIVKTLNTFSRKDEVFTGTYDMHQGIDSTLRLLKNEWISRIDVQKKFGVIPAIECNPGNINQVIFNVISNGIQSIPDKGQITISTRLVEGGEHEVMLTIADTGQGIPSKDLASIFDPFFTTKEIGEGTGLGLAISKRIIENHGGKISVESEEGQGTTFNILLPVTQSSEGLRNLSLKQVV